MNAQRVIAGRFQIVESVGRGGMGTVFRAVDAETGRAVALKVLSGHSSVDIERARREANVLAKLAHPSIVGYVADGTTPDGETYLAMEWVPGTTLNERLQTTGFSLREAVSVLGQTASALDAAHRSGVLHRDIKPSNILLVPPDDRVVLIDFGIARLADALMSLTRTGVAIGTPGYMSPEQARGEREVTPATDVFTLACVFYVCATGQPAFSGSNASAVLVKILLAKPTPLEQLVPEAPRPLCALLDRMLRKDVAWRVPDCATVLRELAAVGDIPSGPRRGGNMLDAPTTPSVTPDEIVHCILAAQGALEDVLDPPDDDQRAALEQLAERHGGTLEVCANGSVALQLRGGSPAVLREAASCALGVRRILDGWSVALARHRDAGEATEAAAKLLAIIVMVDIFGESRGVAIDRALAAELAADFQVEAGQQSLLVAARA